MRILFRYVFREFLIPLFYCLIGFVGIYVLFELFGSYSRISAAHLPFKTVALYFAGYLSPFFHYLAPAALMLATLYTMWNFCRHSELTAMRASGVSLLTIVKPLMLAALLLAVFVGWVNECYMPDHALWAKRLRTARFKVEDAERQGLPRYQDSEAHRRWIVGGADATGCHLKDVQILYVDSADGSEQRLEAEKADYLDGEWWLTNVIRNNDTTRIAPLRVFPAFTETPADMRMQTDGAEFCSARSQLEYRRKAQDLEERERANVTYKAWAQILSPLACLLITLLTIPAGITSGRQSVFSGILGAIGMYFAYYGMTIACLVLAKTGFIPPIPAAILPHAVFLAIGVYFCLRPLRQTMILMGAFMGLFALYVCLAVVLEQKLGMDLLMAQVLAATLPLAGAGLCLVRLRPR